MPKPPESVRRRSTLANQRHRASKAKPKPPFRFHRVLREMSHVGHPNVAAQSHCTCRGRRKRGQGRRGARLTRGLFFLTGGSDFLPQAGHVSLHWILFLLGPRPSALSASRHARAALLDMTARACATLVSCSGAAKAAASEGGMRMASWSGHTPSVLLACTVWAASAAPTYAHACSATACAEIGKQKRHVWRRGGASVGAWRALTVGACGRVDGHTGDRSGSALLRRRLSFSSWWLRSRTRIPRLCRRASA